MTLSNTRLHTYNINFSAFWKLFSNIYIKHASKVQLLAANISHLAFLLCIDCWIVSAFYNYALSFSISEVALLNKFCNKVTIGYSLKMIKN